MSYELIGYKDNLKVRAFVVMIDNRMPHFHNDMEIVYVLKGGVSMEYQGRQVALGARDIFIVETGVVHSVRRTDQPNALLALQFSLDFAGGACPDIGRLRLKKHHLTPEDGACYQNILSSMLAIAGYHRQKTLGFPVLCMGAACAICATMLDQMEHETGPEPAPVRHGDRLCRIMDYVSKHYMHPIALKEIAQREGLSMYYLSHFITANLGMSFQQYLTKTRVRQAEWLIAHTDKRAIDICLECGFSDYRYLKKAFVAEYGVTPAQYKGERRARHIALEQLPGRDACYQHIVLELDQAFEDARSM